jgi:hypothetical protein
MSLGDGNDQVANQPLPSLRQRDLPHRGAGLAWFKNMPGSSRGDCMYNWKIVFVATVLSAALTVTIVHHGSDAFGRVGDRAVAGSRQPAVAATNPVTPTDNADKRRTPDSEFGWGPFRTVDW